MDSTFASSTEFAFAPAIVATTSITATIATTTATVASTTVAAAFCQPKSTTATTPPTDARLVRAHMPVG